MRRFLIAAVAGSLVAAIWIPLGVVVFFASWIALHILSPATCPRCRKGVRFMADTCHHCGSRVGGTTA